jgi:carboxymethylenebutenolidase
MPAETIELATPEGPMPVYHATPQDRPTRAVIVVQDAFGVTDYLETVTADLAALGWLGLAPHLFHRSGSPVIPFDEFPSAAVHLHALTGPGILADLDACLEHLSAAGIRSKRCAVIGFCMGGTVAYLAATDRPIGAAVTFYGQAGASGWEGVGPANERAADLQAPWLGLFGDTDPLVPVSDVERLAAALERAPVPTHISRFAKAGHAFHRISTPDTYDPEAAKQAWQECLDWLDLYVPAVEET